MEQSKAKPRKKRRTNSEILVLLDEFDNSNTSIPEFCVTHDICKATFHKWCSRYKPKPGKQEERNGFTTLKITTEKSSGTAILFAEVKGIKIYQPVIASFLKELATS